MTHINQRRDIAATWTSDNVVLQLGEVGWERDTLKAKIGDGTSAWNDLEYAIQPFEDAALTGVPTAPTAAPATSTTQIATTQFVMVQFALKADLDSPSFTGTPTAPTAVLGTNTTQLATTAFVKAAGDLKADLASPALTGVPTAPTAAGGTNTTQVATTAFVQGLLASPALTGNPTAPTPASTDNDTSVATTAFVQAVRLLGSTSVANVAALPGVGTIGQQIYVEDIDTFAWWDDSTSSWQGYWKSFTTTWNNATLGTTGLVDECKYIKVGKLITVKFRLTFGTGGEFTGTASMSFPFTPAAGDFLHGMGTVVFDDTSVGSAARRTGVVYRNGANAHFLETGDDAGSKIVNSVIPFDWAAGDSISGTFTYEVA